MAQRALMVNLTPPKKMRRQSDITPDVDDDQHVNKSVAVAASAVRRSKRIAAHQTAHNEPCDVELLPDNVFEEQRQSIIDKFFAKKKAKFCKTSKMVSLSKVRMQRERVLQELKANKDSKSLKKLLAKLNTKVKSRRKQMPAWKKTTAQQVYTLIDILYSYVFTYIHHSSGVSSSG